jgi:hypothetical protein
MVTATRDGAFLDRRRVELLDDGLPCLPYHHDAQALPLDQAIDLIARVRASAERHARARLDELARQVTADIGGIAIRACPPLPETVAECLANYRAQNVADTVMFRRALADAATARGWAVRWYDARRVQDEATRALQGVDIGALLERTGAAMGPPWQRDHRIAMAAAIAAGRAAA